MQHLPAEIANPAPVPPEPASGTFRTLKEVERQHIGSVTETTGGSRDRAARVLGISKTTLWRKLRDIGKPKTASGA